MSAVPHAEALVTGARGGLGQALVAQLMATGVTVHRTARDPGQLPPGNGTDHAVELTDADATRDFADRFFREHPGVDLLVNNAGYAVFGGLEDQEPAAVRAQLEVMLHAPMTLSAAAMRAWRPRGHGVIVNVSSLVTAFPLPRMGVYNTAKAGLSGFSRSLDEELHGTGLRVLDWQLGDLRTGFNAAMWAASSDVGDVRSARIRARLDHNLALGLPPERAAAALARLLRCRAHGTHRTGTFFQARMGPLLAAVAPRPLTQAFLRRYFGLS